MPGKKSVKMIVCLRVQEPDGPEGPQPNTSFRRWLDRQAKLYIRECCSLYVLISLYLLNDNVYVLYISCIFPLFVML